MTWEKVRFGDLYSIESRNGLTKPSRVRGSGYKMINMGELFSNDKIYDIPMEYVPLSEREKLNFKVEKGDLLFARQSLVLEGAGKCSIVMEVSPLTVFESHLIRVRLTPEEANPVFYYYYFKSSASPIKTIVSQCAQAGIRGSDLQELTVSKPPLFVQNKIASLLSAYDDLIENNKKQIALLEEAAQRLYKEWFVDLRFPGHENVPVVDGVPEGWEKKNIEKCSSVLRRGISPKYNDEALGLVINQKCIRSSIMDIREARKQEKMFPNNMNLRNNDIVICSTGAGTLGRVGQVFGDYANTTFDSHVTLVRANDAIGNQYLFHFLKSKQPFLQGAGKGSTNQLELSKEIIGNLEIALPGIELIEKFESLAQPMHDKITTLAKENLQLEEQRNYLLPKLMSGEIEV